MRQNPIQDGPIAYQIQVQGRLDPAWADAFNGMAATSRGGVTTLRGPVADQAALRGMLCKLWDLNLALVSVRRIRPHG